MLLLVVVVVVVVMEDTILLTEPLMLPHYYCLGLPSLARLWLIEAWLPVSS
jgi:hypothetical protein